MTDIESLKQILLRSPTSIHDTSELARYLLPLISKALTAEREACAKKCLEVGRDYDRYDDVTAYQCATVISTAALLVADTRTTFHDPTLLERIPAEVVQAEQTLSHWFASENIKQWELGNSRNRF